MRLQNKNDKKTKKLFLNLYIRSRNSCKQNSTYTLLVIYHFYSLEIALRIPPHTVKQNFVAFNSFTTKMCSSVTGT